MRRIGLALSAALLLFSFPAIPGHGNALELSRLDRDFPALIQELARSMPLSFEQAENLGFKFDTYGDSAAGPSYAVTTPIMLTDGVMVSSVHLGVFSTPALWGTIFVLRLGAGRPQRDMVEEWLGEFTLDEKNEIDGQEHYVRKCGLYKIRASYSSEDSGLTELVFDALRPAE